MWGLKRHGAGGRLPYTPTRTGSHALVALFSTMKGFIEQMSFFPQGFIVDIT